MKKSSREAERELVEYIQSQLHKGISKKRIREVLLKVGHSVDSINAALEQIHDVERKNSIVFGAIAAIALLMILGWVFFGFLASQPSHVQESADIGAETPVDHGESADASTKEKALKKGDVGICEGAGIYRDNCILSVSVDQGEASSCALLEDSSLKDICYYKIAIASKNGTLCFQSGSYEEQCISEIALLTYDPDLCENLGEKRYSCYNMIALLTKDASLCEQAGRYKSNCLKMIE